MPRVTVRIEWPGGSRLPKDALARVTVEDVTEADAPSLIKGETVLEDLRTDRAARAEVQVDDVDEGADLVVRVHVAEGSRPGREVEVGDLVTTISHPVLTHGHGDWVVVQPQQIGG